MQVDIYIREKSGKREIRIPILPEEIPFSSGDAIMTTHEVLGLGTVEIPSGVELDGCSWKSELPGTLRQNDPLIRGVWLPPTFYDCILREWKQNRAKLNLLIVGYPFNKDVYLTEYHPKAAGAFGDIRYEIAFKEAKRITIGTTKTATTTTTNTATRPAQTGSSYTIKSGDTLWGIAKKFYGDGSKWTVIYDANKAIIEQTAKKHGKTSSQNGHWIYPGVTLTIPGANTGQTSTATATKTIDELAKEVIQGKWGNGSARKTRLTAAGYDYDAVQARVNQLLG